MAAVQILVPDAAAEQNHGTSFRKGECVNGMGTCSCVATWSQYWHCMMFTLLRLLDVVQDPEGGVLVSWQVISAG